MKNEAIYTQWMSYRTPDLTQYSGDRHQLNRYIANMRIVSTPQQKF